MRHRPWRNALSAGTLGITCLFSGCYLTPNFGPPGTFDQQRARAVLHDPYPNNDVGPPIVSGRPLGFDRPMSEPQSNQYHPRVRRGAAPPPYFGF